MNGEMLAEIKQQPEILKATMDKNRVILEEVRKELKPKIASGAIDNVMIVARGSSDNAAALGKYLIESTLGLPVNLAAPSVVNLYHAKLTLAKTLVIGVSQSGSTNEIVEFMSKVKADSGFTMSITNNPDSELAKLGLGANLFCFAGKEKVIAATKSFTSTVMLFYLISEALADETDGAKSSVLASIPDLIHETLAMAEPQIDDAVAWLGPSEECVILGRGFSYPVALEAGLKLQECSYVRAKAYSGADFQHGPMAVIQERLHFIVLLAEGPCYQSMIGLCRLILERGGRLLVFATQAEPELEAEGAKIIKLPACSEWVSPFVFTTAAQLLAYYEAEGRGLNPDSPRWLNKVTATI